MWTLLSCDFQNALCVDPDNKTGLVEEVQHRGVISRAAAALSIARQTQIPVVHIRVVIRDGRTASASPRFRALAAHGAFGPDAWGTEWVDALAPTTDEPTIEKSCVNPFLGTPLSATLHSLGSTDIAVMGVATNHVVEAVVRHGADSGYRITVLEDACASFSSDAHRFSVESIVPSYGNAVSVDEWTANNPVQP